MNVYGKKFYATTSKEHVFRDYDDKASISLKVTLTKSGRKYVHCCVEIAPTSPAHPLLKIIVEARAQSYAGALRIAWSYLSEIERSRWEFCTDEDWSRP